MMRYTSIAFAIFIMTSVFIVNAQGQCSIKFDYSAKLDSDGSASLNLKSTSGSVQAKIQLYDLNRGGVIVEKDALLNTSYKTIFNKVIPSLYMIYIWVPGCEKPIVVGGGKQGILIEN